MDKAYIIINISKDKQHINNATLYSNEFPIVIKPNKIEELINKYSNIQFKYTNDPYKLIITDQRIVKNCLSGHVSKNSKLVAGTCVLLAGMAITTIITKFGGQKSEENSTQLQNVRNTSEITELASNDEVNHLDQLQFDQQIASSINDINPEMVSQVQNQPADTEIVDVMFADTTDFSKMDFVEQNYGNLCNVYGKRYGIDPTLIKAIIASENPFNEISSVNRGVGCVENVWWGNQITAFNFDTGEYETETIDVNQLNYPEYAIRISCMIYNYHYNYLCQQCPNLSAKDRVKASLIGYNKGIFGIVNLIQKYGADYINRIYETPGGDNLYIEHVLSIIKNGTDISLVDSDGKTTNVILNIMEQPHLSR